LPGKQLVASFTSANAPLQTREIIISASTFT